MAAQSSVHLRSAEAVQPALPAHLLLSAIIDSSDDAILSKALDGTITSWNKAAEHVFSYLPAEIIGCSIQTLVPAHLHAEENEILARLQQGERISRLESFRLRKDGSVFPVALTVTAIRTATGEIIGASEIVRDMSGYQQAQDALYLLEAIVQSSDDAIMSQDLSGRITTWNRSAERMFGYRAEEIIGQSVLNLIPPSLHGEESGILAQLKRGQRIHHLETVRMTKAGRHIDVSLTLSPIHNARGEVVGASNVVRDITEAKKTVVTSGHLASIVDSSEDAIIGKDLSGTITSWNFAAERIFGYRPSEIVGKSILVLIPPELQNEEPAILARLRRGERIDHYETVRVRKDGRKIDVSLTISPIMGADGKVAGVSKIVRDITDVRKADEAIRLLAAIVDSSDDAIVSKSLDGVVTSWNAGAARVFGYTAEEMIGKPISTLFPPDRLTEEPMILERLKRGERVDHYQTVRLRKGGEPLDVSLTISPIKDSAGRIIGASKIARDITQEKRAMAQLNLANQELKRADRMKSEFLAVMSHELRTPLNSIIGFAALVRGGKQGPLNDEQKKSLNLVHASGKHLLHLINDLLDLSRIEAGRMEIEPEEFFPAEVIDEALRSLELQARQKHLEVRRSVEFAEPIFTDRNRLFQVILNLVNNAIKFTPQGSVSIRAWQEGDRLSVSVSDTGIGIPADRQSDLFQAFSQVEGSSRRRFEGTGLGLYLCKKIVLLLGGEISMKSELHRGSVFTFSIPVSAPVADAPMSAGANRPNYA